MKITAGISVSSLLGELVSRCSDANHVIKEGLASLLSVNGDTAVGVAGAHHVEFSNSGKLFLQYKQNIPGDDPIRRADVFTGRRYSFGTCYLSPSLDQGANPGHGYYVLRNMGWREFQKYLDFFNRQNILEEAEVAVIQSKIDESVGNAQSLQPKPIDNSGQQSSEPPAGNPNRYEIMCARNMIVFGAPGTGKSYLLEEKRKGNENGVRVFPDANYERVTFYATYSYAQFVGTYKPVMKGEGVNEKIAYQFVPGPFLRTLVKALNRPEENFLLIIEEINRANAAAVFGDVFQLLDRGVDGVSDYSIAASEDVKKYLEKVLTEGGKQALVKLSGSVDVLKIPANLYLWATMNSADQGVFPLDTAFKRRWSFEYIGIDEGAPKAPDLKIQIKNEIYDWKTLRKFLNRLLVLNGVNEDKLMGPFFLKDSTEFDSKVLMYLWEDAARMCRRAVFGGIKTYSELCKSWADMGIVVFNTKAFDDKDLQDYEHDLVNA